MIQRIQTLFLLIILLITPSIIYFFSDWVIQFFVYFIIYVISVGVITISSILFYFNRLIQIYLNLINIFINILILGFLIYFYNIYSSSREFILVDKKLFGMLIPLFNLLFLLIANYNIKKDETLIKSIDRIR